MPIGAAISGGLGLAGSIGSALIGSNAAKEASANQMALGEKALSTQTALGQQGIQTLLDMFNQAKGIVQPVINTGSDIIGTGRNILSTGGDISASVLPTLRALLTPGANMTDTLSKIPGFQFAQDWGQKAVQNLGTTTGLGGNVLKAGADYATGVAQQGYGSIVDRLMALFSGGVNTMGVGANVLGTGASTMAGPASALASGAISTGNSAFGNLNQLGATIGSTLGGIGTASAAGTLGSANALAGGISGGVGSVSNAFLLSKLLGGGGSGFNTNAPNNGSGIYTGDPSIPGFGN